jgi:hypothetical protein
MAEGLWLMVNGFWLMVYFYILQPGGEHEHPPRALGRSQPSSRRARQELLRHREATPTGYKKK